MKPIAAVLAILLAGCAGTKPYAGLPEKNLQVRTAAVGAAVVMSVHSLDSKCFAEFEGVVTLDRPLIEIGLPADRLSLLVFEFYSLGLSPGGRSLKKEARLLPRPGYRYEARVTYKDSLYGVELWEIDPRSAASRELDTRRGC
jgi:hypothetical protein